MPPLAIHSHIAPALAAAARRVGYDEAGLARLLGLEGEPVPVSRLTAPSLTPRCTGGLGTWVRLFLLRSTGRTAPTAREAERALGGSLLAELVAAGLLERRAGRITSPVQLVVDDGGLLMSDPGGVRCASDHVMALGPSSLDVWALTPAEVAGRRFLELGTGSGGLALRWARRGARLTATDVNPRALALAGLNAALSGLTLELVEGDRFAPLVPGERYDGIFMNAPFVIGAPHRLLFRDPGEPGDDFVASLVRGVGQHLSASGSLRIALAWLDLVEAEGASRVASWLPDGHEGWLHVRRSHSVDRYVESWLAESGERGAYAARCRAWTGTLRSLGATRVHTGLLVVRPGGGGLTMVPSAEGIDASLGAVVDRWLDAKAQWTHHAHHDVRHARVSPVEGLRISQGWCAAAGAWDGPETVLETTRGLSRRLQVDARVMAVVSRLDGRRTVVEIGRAHV